MGKYDVRLFHGSSVIVDKPVFGFGSINNDYGLGFYCTENVELAREWACSEANTSWCNEYTMDISGLKILNLANEEYNELQWLALLLNNRNVRLDSSPIQDASRWIIDRYLIDVSDYDVIIGYRADDSFFSIARAFVSNTMPLEALSDSLKRGDLGLQFVLKSERSFERISFVNAESVNHSIYYPRRNARGQAASKWFFRQHFETRSNGTFLNDLIRG